MTTVDDRLVFAFQLLSLSCSAGFSVAFILSLWALVVGLLSSSSVRGTNSVMRLSFREVVATLGA